MKLSQEAFDISKDAIITELKSRSDATLSIAIDGIQAIKYNAEFVNSCYALRVDALNSLLNNCDIISPAHSILLTARSMAATDAQEALQESTAPSNKTSISKIMPKLKGNELALFAEFLNKYNNNNVHAMQTDNDQTFLPMITSSIFNIMPTLSPEVEALTAKVPSPKPHDNYALPPEKTELPNSPPIEQCLTFSIFGQPKEDEKNYYEDSLYMHNWELDFKQ